MTEAEVLRQARIEQWLYREARLLDERRWDLWLDLMDEQIRYVVPDRTWRLQSDVRDFATWSVDAELSPPWGAPLIDEDLAALRQRVARFQSRMGWSEMPASMTRRIVSNVMIDAVQGSLLSGGSNLFLSKVRPDEVALFTAQRRDQLIDLDGDGLRLRSRTVVLDAVVLPSENLSLLF